jgi:hypothetical protein
MAIWGITRIWPHTSTLLLADYTQTRGWLWLNTYFYTMTIWGITRIWPHTSTLLLTDYTQTRGRLWLNTYFYTMTIWGITRIWPILPLCCWLTTIRLGVDFGGILTFTLWLSEVLLEYDPHTSTLLLTDYTQTRGRLWWNTYFYTMAIWGITRVWPHTSTLLLADYTLRLGVDFGRILTFTLWLSEVLLEYDPILPLCCWLATLRLGVDFGGHSKSGESKSSSTSYTIEISKLYKIN